MDTIERAAADLNTAENLASVTGAPEDSHEAATAWCRLVRLCDHQAPGWGETAAELFADGDDQAAAAVLTAGTRA